MFKRVILLALVSTLILSLAGCGGGEPAQEAKPEAAAPAAAPAPPPKDEPVYELTKDDITSHSDWTSRNISFLGLKLGDKTNSFTKQMTLPLGGTASSNNFTEQLTKNAAFGRDLDPFGEPDHRGLGPCRRGCAPMNLL